MFLLQPSIPKLGTRKRGANVPTGVVLVEQKLVRPKSWELNKPDDIWKATPIDKMFLECDARIDLCWFVLESDTRLKLPAKGQRLTVKKDLQQDDRRGSI